MRVTWIEAQPFLVSLAIGLLLGVERERRHRPIPAGSRTFALVSLIGALTATLGPDLVAVGLAGVVALAIAAYLRTSADDPGTTTEVSMVVAFLLGALTVTRPALAVALAVVTAALLESKERLHHFARDVMTEVELDDALKFFVVAFVVFPMLPDRGIGPYGAVNPSNVWRLVVLLTGIGWVGYLGVRALGSRRGLLVTGLAGGFVSASATTASLARRSRMSGELRPPLAGALLASAATIVQLLLVVGVVDERVLARTLPAGITALVLLVVPAIILYLGTRESAESAATDHRGPHPFALLPALLLAGVLTVALLLGRWAAEVLGTRGSVLAAGATGLADAHAGALSAATLAERGDISITTALLAAAAALAVNTIVKAGLAFGAGGRRFGLAFVALILPAVVGYGVVLALTIAAT